MIQQDVGRPLGRHDARCPPGVDVSASPLITPPNGGVVRQLRAINGCGGAWLAKLAGHLLGLRRPYKGRRSDKHDDDQPTDGHGYLSRDTEV